MTTLNAALARTIITPDHDAVICEIEIAAPAEIIFRALTESDLLLRWWNGEAGPCRTKVWEFDPRVGGRHRHVAYDPTGQMKVNGLSEFEVWGEIVEINPPRSLAYTWYANFHSQREHATLVRWELAPDGDRTIVKMTHGRLKPLPEGASYANGWPGVVAGLKKFAELHADQRGGEK
jgi:uncharacterized protein YndB with AHSA1/START domain